MKLLYITNGINGSGGLERVLSIKASALADQQDYQVGILVLNDAYLNPFYKFSDKIQMMSVVAKGNPLRYFRQYRKGIKKTIAQFQPDVISVCDDGLKGTLFPILFGKKTPIIYERHASFEIFNKSEQSNLFSKLKLYIQKKIIQWGAKSFDHFVVLTKGNTTEWKLPNLKVIANPLSFYPKTTSALTNNKVIAVGNHGFTKGMDRLLKVWKLVSAKHQNWELNIYGKKDPAKKLEKYLEKNKFQKSVQLYDPVNNIKDKYLESSLYAMTSRSEGFGMVLIEAMACGLPCIAFDIPHGPADIITDGVDGFLIPDGDIQAFADKISYLIENPDVRKKMGKAARENVKRYLPEQIMPKWDKLFKNLINK